MTNSAQNGSPAGQILVAQLGARRHYAVPVALERRGLLSRLYTDLYAGPAQRAGMIGRIGQWLRWPAVGRWSARTNSALPLSVVTDFPLFGLAYKGRGMLAASQEARLRNWLWGGERFCKLVGERDSGDSGVYVFTSAGLALLQRAQERGVPGFLDHATAPQDVELGLVAEECERFPGWAAMPPATSGPWLKRYAARQRQEWAAAHTIICGSSFVRGVIEHEGGPAEKTVVVPLGLDTPVRNAEPARSADECLHVLFVGDAGLRKGIGYLVEAMGLLGSNHVAARAVGHLRLTEVGRRAVSRQIELVGAVSRVEMRHHYEWADVLVLPSVSDTFALVILEAMAAGLPVITTVNTGGPDVLREGQDGFCVPIRSAEAVAERIELLATDRRQLKDMSVSARRRVEDFTLEKYGERLAKVIHDAYAHQHAGTGKVSAENG